MTDHSQPEAGRETATAHTPSGSDVVSHNTTTTQISQPSSAAAHSDAALPPPRSENTMTDKPISQDSAGSAPAAATPTPVVIQHSGGKGLGLGALVLSLLALGASGLIFVQGQNLLKTYDLSMTQKLNAAGVGQTENARLLQNSIHEQDAIKADVARLQGQITQNQTLIAQTNLAYQEVLKTRSQWVVNETEYTLNTAAQQLLLTGNVNAATAALTNVQNRLNEFDRPELLPLKQAVAADLNNLRNMPSVDVPSAALQLDALEAGINNLPLLADTVMKPNQPIQATALPANAPWYQRTWQGIKDSFRGLVEVRHLDNKDAILLSPDQAWYVRENLRLRILDARVALMQNQAEIYKTDLDTLDSTIKKYYDTNAPATVAWVDKLQQLQKLQLQTNRADLLKHSLAVIADLQQAGSLSTAPLPNPAAASAAATGAPAAAAPAAASAPATAANASDATQSSATKGGVTS